MPQNDADADQIFSGLMQEALERSRTEMQKMHEVNVVQSLLGCPPGSAVLDVPCGAGRLTLQLAARGYHMTGVDITRPLLDTARREAEAGHLQIAFEERDMRDLPWKETFNGVVCFWESFGYFDDEDNLAFLLAAASTLKPGGRFVFDTQIAETLFPKLQTNRDWVQVGDILVLEERIYNFETGFWHRDWTLIRGGETEKRSITIRVYTYRQLTDLLTRAGFGDFEAYSFLSEAPFKLNAQRLLMVAKKL